MNDEQKKNKIQLAVGKYGGTPLEAMQTIVRGLEETLGKLTDPSTIKMYRQSITEHREILEELTHADKTSSAIEQI